MADFGITEIALVSAAVAAAAGAGTTAMASMRQASAAENQAEQQAQWAKLRARSQAREQEIAADRLRGRQIAAAAKSGLDVGVSGTVQEVLGETAREMELKRQWILWEGNAQAAGLGAQAAGYKAQGEAAMMSGIANVGSTLLTAWSKYPKTTKKSPDPSLTFNASDWARGM